MKNLQVIVAVFMAIYLALYLSTCTSLVSVWNCDFSSTFQLSRLRILSLFYLLIVTSLLPLNGSTVKFIFVHLVSGQL